MNARRRTRPAPAPVQPVSHGLQWLACASLGLAVVVLCGLWPLRGGDLVMHQVVGRWIWLNGWVPLTDPFSYVTGGQEFIAHSWGAEVLFYLIEHTSGTAGFLMLRFLPAGLR